MMTASDLPNGAQPAPLPFAHFPDRLHALVWRNWPLVPVARIGEVIGATTEQVLALGRSMGLPPPPELSPAQLRGTRLTVIRRNWHLLPYDQLLQLLGWTAVELSAALQEDDFLWVKLGRLKPSCERVSYREPDDGTRTFVAGMAKWVAEFGGPGAGSESLLAFVGELSCPPIGTPGPRASDTRELPQALCYSYFGLYGDPLLEPECDPYPDGYLARLAASGVDAVWLPGLLTRLAPFPWEPELSARWEERLASLERLAERAARFGIRVYLYLNEPRSMPLAFFERHPELRGVAEDLQASLCTSVPQVHQWLADAVTTICGRTPGLGGFITITASENLTSCWSHNGGDGCERCAPRSPAEVFAEVNTSLLEGIQRSGSGAQLIAWDWGWPDDEAEAAIRLLPPEAVLMSVSEWKLPIQRGGVWSEVGEYCLSAVGPGPRAERHWAVAKECGLRTMAKIQANTTWELSAVPYLPVLENVALHAARLRELGVDGLMVGWTLGGYPSPNLEVVAAVMSDPDASLLETLRQVATRHFGVRAADAMVAAWRAWSEVFQEFPYHIRTVYYAPLQLGPANLLWEQPTGYAATMVGFAYDDLRAWRSVYPEEVFEEQLRIVARGFGAACEEMLAAVPGASSGSEEELRAIQREAALAEVAMLHFWSVSEQARFVRLRDELLSSEVDPRRREALCDDLAHGLNVEIILAKRLYELQRRYSWIGCEASNQYYYVPLDLVEKVLNCRDLLGRWLPCKRACG